MKRFWSKVAKGGRNECWLWTGGTVSGGGGMHYGAFWYEGGPTRAHRVAWELFNETEIPKGWLVMHSCDVPLCCNPKHLLVGTKRMNAHDRDRKGRQVTKHGTEHVLAKLTDDDVRAIRESPHSQRALAKHYGVAQSLIGRILRGASWAHVE